MTLRSWIRNAFAAKPRTLRKNPTRFRPTLQVLEDRLAPALLVNSFDDNTIAGDGQVTLREAILAANNDVMTDLGQSGSGADAITFDAVVFASPEIITLELGELSITDSLSITGPTVGLTINGRDLSRIFNVNDASNDAIAVAISGLTLTHGNAIGTVGGAIRNSENLTLTDCVLSNNSAVAGGAIYNLGGAATLTNCALSHNFAVTGAGGAIANIGAATLTLTDCILSSNSADNGAGAIFNRGTATLTNCDLVGNSAALGAGGMSNDGTATLTNCDLVRNRTTAEGTEGGGIANSASGTLTLTNCTLSDNSAEHGGGILNEGMATLTDCDLVGNSAVAGDFSGAGGIYNRFEATLILNNCYLSENSATYGGGIYNEGSATLTNCTLAGNSASEGGGGIFNDGLGAWDGGTMMLTNCTLSGNSATYGGGIMNSGDATLTNCTLAGNSAVADDFPGGGGIANYGSMTLYNTIVTNSVASDDVVNEGTLSGSRNLIETVVTGPGTNSLTGTITADPNLGPLQDNGGPTWTHALLSGSPAIDFGDDPGGLDFDQRGLGFARSVDGDGDGEARVDIGAFEFGAGPANNPPVNSVPGPQSTPEDVPLVFSSANGNALSVFDAEAGENPVQVTLLVTNGTLTLGTTTDLIVSGNDSNTVELTGSIADINEALAAGLTFTPELNFNAVAWLTIITNDLGSTGFGGEKIDTDMVAINVLSEEEQINNLSGDVDETSLRTGQKNALTSILANAQARLLAGDIGAAINQLEAFINAVRALIPHLLTSEEGNELIAAANLILSGLREGG